MNGLPKTVEILATGSNRSRSEVFNLNQKKRKPEKQVLTL